MAKTIKLQELKNQYDFACNEYLQKFCNKQQIESDGWVGDEVGGIASFCCEYFFSISDIVFDINSKQPKGLILQWQNDGVEYNMCGDKNESINYKSYTMGLRYEQLENLK
jgi:hypothetical protein